MLLRALCALVWGYPLVAFPHALVTRVPLAWGAVTGPLWYARTGRDPLASDVRPAYLLPY